MISGVVVSVAALSLRAGCQDVIELAMSFWFDCCMTEMVRTIAGSPPCFWENTCAPFPISKPTIIDSDVKLCGYLGEPGCDRFLEALGRVEGHPLGHSFTRMSNLSHCKNKFTSCCKELFVCKCIVNVGIVQSASNEQ